MCFAHSASKSVASWHLSIRNSYSVRICVRQARCTSVHPQVCLNYAVCFDSWHQRLKAVAAQIAGRVPCGRGVFVPRRSRVCPAGGRDKDKDREGQGCNVTAILGGDCQGAVWRTGRSSGSEARVKGAPRIAGENARRALYSVCTSTQCRGTSWPHSVWCCESQHQTEFL